MSSLCVWLITPVAQLSTIQNLQTSENTMVQNEPQAECIENMLLTLITKGRYFLTLLSVLFSAENAAIMRRRSMMRQTKRLVATPALPTAGNVHESRAPRAHQHGFTSDDHSSARHTCPEMCARVRLVLDVRRIAQAWSHWLNSFPLCSCG